MFIACATLGLVFLASRYHTKVLRGVKKLCHNIAKASYACAPASNPIDDSTNCDDLAIPSDNIILADSPEKCDYAIQRIRCDLSDGPLGFDCEWVNDGPVSLLQLATFGGVCALFRLGKIGYVPTELKELLANERILKVGVAAYEDGRKLETDYDCRVSGTVDLRALAQHLGVPSCKSLATLAREYLRIEMKKFAEVRCGDWDADVLNDRQIAYAAFDAIASVLIYHEIQKRVRGRRSFWENFVIRVKSAWSINGNSRRRGGSDVVPEEIIDARFKAPSEKSETGHDSSGVYVRAPTAIVRDSKTLRKKNAITVRKEPLYHNCCLEAPDGETLCTCDRKKAMWYVNRQLGTVIKEQPLTVRLNFEPSGRALGQVGKYYTQIKMNRCVVCGSSDSLIKKNVVPREYRKYFPLVMKAHQSHDVLLLCLNCHESSNLQDLELRRRLAYMCDAPLARIVTSGQDKESKNDISAGIDTICDSWQERRPFVSAVMALGNNSPIPPSRRKQLETLVLEFTGLTELKPGLIDFLYERLKAKTRRASATKWSSLHARCHSHGAKVVHYFEERQAGGLVTLERMWREHFLETMRPRFLPNLWSVSHNQERLVIRRAQRRIEPHDAKLAGLLA